MEKQPKNQFQLHPWHGIEIGENAPKEIKSFIEITPSDSVKYEIDKASGFLKVDRKNFRILFLLCMDLFRKRIVPNT